MAPLIKASLSLLRLAAQATFFLEAQRLLLRLVRPVRTNHLEHAENHVLSRVRTPLSHRWIADGQGHNIHVIEAGSGARVAVLLHGHSMSAAFWFRNFDDLVSLGYHVYAIDLLGWGRSERPAFRGCTPEQGIAWYLDSFNGVISSLKLSKFSLLGHSLGAYLSMEYTNCKPHMVENLVLVSPAGAVRSVPVSRAAFFSLTPQFLVRRGGLLGFLLFNAHYPRSKMYVQHRLRDYTYHLAAQFPPSGELAVRPIIKLFGPRRAECIRPLIERTKFFSVPVHIVCGDTDSSMPLEDVHTLYRDMKRKGFNVQLSTVVGSDHCPMLEKPDDFFNLMSAITKTTTPKFTPISGPL